MAVERIASARPIESVLATNKLIRNTYTLLAMTLLFSAVTAAVSMALPVGRGISLICLIAGFVLMVFVLPRFANSASGIGIVFLGTGLLGFALGPMLSAYLSLSNGPQIIGTALGGTGVIFLGLSGYAMTTRKDFSFMGGFLFVGILVVLFAILANIFLQIPALSMAISSAVILIMSGFILYDTGRLVNGQETNYVLATVGLYLAIFNIFIHLLSLLGFMGGED